jgi:hypothetical protein
MAWSIYRHTYLKIYLNTNLQFSGLGAIPILKTSPNRQVENLLEASIKALVERP